MRAGPKGGLVSQFERSARLRSAQRLGGQAVAAAMQSGRSARGKFVRLYFRSNALPFARLALVVSKRLSPRAVERSRVRRVAREAFRLRQDGWAGFDCVVRLVAPYRADNDLQGELARMFERRR